MTVQTVPYALQAASHPASVFRQAQSAPFATAGALSALELACTQQASPNMSVILGAGRAQVAGTSVSPPAGLAFTTQAQYNVLNDAPLTLTVAAASAVNPRIDLVYIQVQDAFYSGAANQAIAGIVTGTPAPVPGVPATPSNAIAIATIAVAANATSIVNANIGRTISIAQLIGVPFSVADLNALAAITGMSIGNQTQVQEGGAEFIYNGSRWAQATAATFASSAAQTTAYAKASGAYLVAGEARAHHTDTNLDYVYNGTAWKTTTAALCPIVPTTATVPSGVITVGSSGVVTLQAATAVSLNGIGTSEFDNIKLVCDFGSTTFSSLLMRFRAGGADISTATYDDQTNYFGGTTTNNTDVGATSAIVSLTGSGSNAASFELDIWDLFPAQVTRYKSVGTKITSAPAVASTFCTGEQRNSASYDGVTFTPNSGTLSGTIRVYGWNNN